MTATDTRSIDLQDERLDQRTGLSGALHGLRSRVTSGDLGSIPVVVGLIIIWAVFEILNPVFLSPANLVNLAMNCAIGGTMAVGIVFILLLGEIDLSVGSMSGLAAGITSVLFVNMGWDLALSVLIALAAGAVVGLFYGFLYTRFGVPSFVITLGGLLGLLGLQLWVLGPSGTINIPFDSWLVWFAQQAYMPAWLAYAISVLAGVVYVVPSLMTARRRTAVGLSAPSTVSIIVRGAIMAAVFVVVSWYLNQGRGIGYMFLLFIVIVVAANYALSRTRWGRSVYAVGGNVEAARRAGIKVRRVYLSVFVITAVLASVGGLLAAGRLAAAGQASGGGDVKLNAIAAAGIGGTSLFGGRGNAYSALLGVVVIQSISSGLPLLNLDSSVRYIITGAVLLVAVIIDALSRRTRAAKGRA